jgi:hypothetical protein
MGSSESEIDSRSDESETENSRSGGSKSKADTSGKSETDSCQLGPPNREAPHNTGP